MKQVMQRLLVILASAVLIGSFSAAPVYANDGDDDAQASTTSVTPKPAEDTSTDDVNSGNSGRGRSGRGRVAEQSDIEDRVEAAKAKAKANVDAIKARASEKSAEVRQQACEARESNIARRMENAVSHVEKHKSVFDKILDRAMAFKEEKALTVADYDALVAVAQNAGAQADAAASALSSLQVDIDCSDPDGVAAALSSFKQATEEARSALKSYRTAIKDLVKNIKASAEVADDTTATPSPEPTETSNN